MNNIFVLNSLFFGFSMFLISILVLLRRGDELGRRWFYFSVFVTGWAIPNAFLVDNRVSHDLALLASRLSHASVAFIPATWLYFVCKFLEIERKKVFLAAWPIAWFLMFTAPTVWFVPSVSSAKGYMNMTEAGLLFHLQTVNFFLVVAYGFYLLMKSYFREKSKEQRKEIFALLFATGIGFAGGGSNFSLVYLRDNGLDITLLLSLYPFLMAFALVRERLLDVEKIADAFQREKLAAIGLLASSIHHELRSPLYVAQGTLESYLENAKDGIYKNDGSEQSAMKAMEISLKQLKRAGEIMQKLTDFAKPQVAKRDLEKVPVKEVLEHVFELVGFQFDLGKIRLSQEIDESLIIQGSRRQLEEIFFNLITNSCQAMKAGCQLKLKASYRNGTVQVEIQDEGPGIPENQLPKIFQPFYTTKKSGTGLGLYITKQLVERDGGSIKVKSVVGKGTTFILAFRAVERSQNIAVEKAAPICSREESQLVSE